MNEDKIRENLINYINQNGIKYNHLADQVKLDKYKICRFKNNKRKLKSYELEKLEKYLDQVN